MGLSTHYDPYNYLCHQGLDVPLPYTENTYSMGLVGYCQDQHCWHPSRHRIVLLRETADIRACYLLARLKNGEENGHEAGLEAALNRARHPVDTRIITKWLTL